MSNVTNNNYDPNAVGPVQTSVLLHEESDVSISGLAKSGVALVTLILVASLLVWGAFSYFNRSAERAQSQPSPMFKGNQPPPEPRLQGAPGHQSSGLDDMLEMRERENRILSSYGWVDQQSGVVHIPIEEAKKLILERGMAGSVEETSPRPPQPGK
jgi:hypothetical protein